MSSDRTVLEHLLDGRDALVLEVARLTTAIDEIDAVIGRIGGAVTATVGDQFTAADPQRPQPVDSPVEVEASSSTSAPKGTTTPAKRGSAKSTGRTRKAASAKKSTPRSDSSGGASGGQKSIRVHVLEMLAAENRDFGLAEIIDRIHAEGIQAHDDAVRSITIKLMKDGRVERVGRGLYRLAGRPASAGHAPTSTATEPERPAQGAQSSPPEQPAQADQAAQASNANYVPPLNLGQPWERS